MEQFSLFASKDKTEQNEAKQKKKNQFEVIEGNKEKTSDKVEKEQKNESNKKDLHLVKNDNEKKEKKNTDRENNSTIEFKELTEDNIEIEELNSFIGAKLPKKNQLVKVYRNFEFLFTGKFKSLKQRDNDIVWFIETDKETKEVIDDMNCLIEKELSNNDKEFNNVTEEDTKENNEDVLEKIENLDFDSSLSKISLEDEAKMKEIQKQYDNYIEYTEKLHDFIKENKKYEEKSNFLTDYYGSDYITPSQLEDHIKGNKRDRTKEYVNNIVDYFKNHYDVTLNNEKIHEVYEEEDNEYSYIKNYSLEAIKGIHYKDIVELILEQIKDYSSFKEKSLTELKERFAKQISNGLIRNEVNGEELYLWDIMKYKYSYGDKIVSDETEHDRNIRESVKHKSYRYLQNLLKIIVYYETNETSNTELHNYIENMIKELKGEHSNIFKEKHILPEMFKKTRKIKFLKNGKVEITFVNMEEAKKFQDKFITEDL